MVLSGAGGAPPARWTPAVEVLHRGDRCVSYQARIDGELLVLRVRVEPGWQSFSMDNKARGPGDRITALDGTRVWTFGDLQYRYDKVDRKARQIEVEVDRGGKAPVLRIASEASPPVARGAANSS